MDTKTRLLTASIRKEAYRCLSECYYLPHEGLAIFLSDLQRQLRSLNSDALPGAVEMENEFRGADDLETLKVDYSRLFVGPYTLLAPPFGSIYLDETRQIMGESTMNVLKQYRAAGLDIARDFPNPPDHIAAELEFMSFLIFMETGAISNSDEKMMQNALDRQKAFIAGHLGTWVHEFTEKIESNAETYFYQSLAKTTRRFISEEISRLLPLTAAAASIVSTVGCGLGAS